MSHDHTRANPRRGDDGGSDRDFGELAREVEDFKRVSKLLTWVRRQQP